MFFNNAFAGTTIMLPQASTMAAKVDGLHDFLTYLSVFFLAVVTIGLIVFVAKYHNSKKGRMTSDINDNHMLEFLWTVGPLLIMLMIFAWGYMDYLEMRKSFKDSIEINVTGKQWMWNFEYANGRKALNDLVLPKGKPVRLIMSSDDVIHSFFIPNFRLKADVPPGLYTRLEFIATETGVHPIYCTEFCGAGHSDMLGRAIVVDPADYEKYYETGKLSAAVTKMIDSSPTAAGVMPTAASTAADGGATESLADKGKKISEQKGCVACHSNDGSAKVGPSYKGMFGRTEELTDGSKVTVDENYIRESVYEPQKKVVKGFAPSMPTFKGLVSEEELNALVAYFKSLK